MLSSKLLSIIAFCSFLFFGMPLNGFCENDQDSKRKLIEKLMDVTGVKRASNQAFTNLLAQIKEENPEVSNALAEYGKQVDYSELLSRCVPVYNKYFNQAELEELLEFYNSDLGKKILATMPQINGELMEIANNYGRELRQEIVRKQLVFRPTPVAIDAKVKTDAEKNYLKACLEEQHWRKQLALIENGEPWRDIEGYNSDNELVLSKAIPITAQSKNAVQQQIQLALKFQKQFKAQLGDNPSQNYMEKAAVPEAKTRQSELELEYEIGIGRKLSADEFATTKLSGTAVLSGTEIICEYYNGSENFKITSIDIEITRKRDGAVRVFRMMPKAYIPLSPLSVANFHADIGGFLDDVGETEWSWKTISAIGLKKI